MLADVEDTCVRVNWLLRLVKEKAPNCTLLMFIDAAHGAGFADGR